MTKDILRAAVRYWVERRFRNKSQHRKVTLEKKCLLLYVTRPPLSQIILKIMSLRPGHIPEMFRPRVRSSAIEQSLSYPRILWDPLQPRRFTVDLKWFEDSCVRVLVYSTSFIRNELICGYANVLHTSSSFRPHTHTHSHTTWGPCIHDRDSGSTVYTRVRVRWITETPPNNPVCTKRVSVFIVLLRLDTSSLHERRRRKRLKRRGRCGHPLTSNPICLHVK